MYTSNELNSLTKQPSPLAKKKKPSPESKKEELKIEK